MGSSHLGLKSAGVLALLLAAVSVGMTLLTSGWDRLSGWALLAPLWFVVGIVWACALILDSARGKPVPARVSAFAPAVFLTVVVLSGLVAVAPSHLWPTAAMGISASISGVTVHVGGETDLPDGSLVYVDATHADMILLGEGKEVTVTSGKFEAVIDLERWPNGEVLVTAHFEVNDRQPSSAIEIFGPNGESLRGPGVREDSDGFRYLSAWAEVPLTDGLQADDPRALKQPASVIGFVADASGVGIIEATVACSPEGRPSTLGEQPVAGGGFYCVLQPGRYTITARAPGFQTQSVVLNLEPGADELLDFTMVPAGR